MSITCSSMLACPTCGPNCNYECQSGICVEVPRDDNRVSNVSKTRGVPSMGSAEFGPRGQRQAFRGFEGSQVPKGMTMNIGQLVMGYLAVGLTAFVVGYSVMKGKEIAN